MRIDDIHQLKRALEKLQAITPVSMEEMLCGPDYFNLQTATPLQRAVCRAVDGLPLGSLWATHDVAAAFGGVQPNGRPVELDLLSGIRAGKSLLVAALAVHWSQTCDVSRLGPGEVARVSVVSLKVDLANVVFNHIVGNLQAQPKLRALLVEQPGTDSVLLRHPSGKHVEIKVVAGTRAGASLVARWSAGCIFDEFTRMLGSEDGVVNYEDSRAAVLARLLPGAQIASIGSPWASTGPAYTRFLEHWGKQGVGQVTVVKAPGWAMNPVFWTPERCQKLKESNPDVYRTDCAAEFSSAEDAYYTAEEVARCMRPAGPPQVARQGADYFAAMDPASRGNGWTLALAHRDGNRLVVDLACEWRGSQSEPLDPGAVLGEIKALLGHYGVRSVFSDQVMGDALRSLGRREGLHIVQVQSPQSKRVKGYANLKTLLSAGQIELPCVAGLREDLLRVRRRVTPAGFSPHLPETADGRHCDYVPTLVLVASRHLGEVRLPSDDSVDAKRARELQRTKARLAKKWGQPKA